MSDSKDVFDSEESEKTVMMPSPGGLKPDGTKAASIPPESTEAFNYTTQDVAPPVAGINPLVAAANPLLDIVPQLRHTVNHPNPTGLRDYLAKNIQTFETRANQAGVDAKIIFAARYILCTLLDETAASTPWGGSGAWSKLSLLVLFHKETFGGKTFFDLLTKLAQNPAANIDILELMYICLALGFEGQYRVVENGRSQLEALRERLALIIRKAKGDFERDLSPAWRGTNIKRSKVLAILPLWVAAAIASLVLLVAYLIFNYKLNVFSDPVFAKIQSIRVTSNIPKAPPAPPPPQRRIARFLEKEIHEGLVAVNETDIKSVVTIKGDRLFAPGSATISENYLALINRIADGINAVPGHVQITGHTDNIPIRSVRFPSNWHLSQSRAESVLELIANKVPKGRLSAEGRAESEPIVPNDTPENRSRNRRVEITLFAAQKP